VVTIMLILGTIPLFFPYFRFSNTGQRLIHCFLRDLLYEGIPDPSIFPNPQTVREMEEMGLTGTWFDFDDTRVLPVAVESIATQYAGKSECACILKGGLPRTRYYRIDFV
jgi:hypothetical protein